MITFLNKLHKKFKAYRNKKAEIKLIRLIQKYYDTQRIALYGEIGKVPPKKLKDYEFDGVVHSSRVREDSNGT